MIGAAVEYVRSGFPEIYERLGEGPVRESVVVAMRNAQRYGLEEWSAVLLYLDAMYVLGFDFDQDPQHPWAGEILNDPALSPSERIQLITDSALWYASSSKR